MLGKIKLGISIGDPNGIGIEIILKIFEDRRLFEFFTPLIFAPIKLLENQKKHFKFNSSLTLRKINHQLHKAQLNVFDLNGQLLVPFEDQNVILLTLNNLNKLHFISKKSITR